VCYIDDLCLINDLTTAPIYECPFTFDGVRTTTVWNDFIQVSNKKCSTERAINPANTSRIRCSIRTNTWISTVNSGICRKYELINRASQQEYMFNARNAMSTMI